MHLLIAFALALSVAACRESKPISSDESPTVSTRPSSNSRKSTPSEPGACDNKFFPLKTGDERRYRVAYKGGQVKPLEYTETTTDLMPDSFTQQWRFPDLTVSTGWKCTPAGLRAVDYGNVYFTNAPNRFKLKTVESSGVSLPPEGRWRVGESWGTKYEVRGTMQGAGSQQQAEVSGPIEIENKIVAQDSVTVPAGTFTAFKVDSTVTTRFTVTVRGMKVPTNLSLKSSAWFAPDVGLVKSVAAGDLGSGTTELISY